MTYLELLNKYIIERRALGYLYQTEGRYLKRFTEFVDSKETPFLRVQDFLDWKNSFGNANASTWSQRLGVYRKFARWVSAYDIRTEVPPSDLIPSKGVKRKKPYIYTDEERRLIIESSKKLKSRLGLRSLTYSTLFSLISVTGLRINEAVKLKISDIDLINGVIFVEEHGKSSERFVPITQSVVSTLRSYYDETLRLTSNKTNNFFVVEDAKPISEYTTRYAFSKVGQDIGLRKRQKYGRHGHGPRIHDLRHTFAVNTLINAFKNNENIGDVMYRLSAFLGHRNVEGTYWYIEAVPELMLLASQKMSSVNDYNSL